VVVILLMEETEAPRENHRPVASRWKTLSQNVISSTPRQLLVVIGTYCTVSCKSNYHTITATTAIQNKTKHEQTLLLLLRHEIYTDTGKTLLLLLRHEIYTDTGQTLLLLLRHEIYTDTGD
jgi:hypothetical protein